MGVGGGGVTKVTVRVTESFEGDGEVAQGLGGGVLVGEVAADVERGLVVVVGGTGVTEVAGHVAESFKADGEVAQSDQVVRPRPLLGEWSVPDFIDTDLDCQIG